MTSRSLRHPAHRPSRHSRRDVLRALAFGALALPLAACGPGYDEGPDDLITWLAQARADAEAAAAIAAGDPAAAETAKQVAAVRSAHADALRAEIDRENRPEPETPPAPARATDLAGLRANLEAVREQAGAGIGALPAHRAALIGSVAAGCAAAQQLAPELRAEATPEVEPVTTGELSPEAVDALQQALAAEHAAVWVYGLVSAFLSADFASGVDDGAEEHRDRRDAGERALTAAGATPVPAEAAYVPPQPVTDQASAVSLVATAEADATAAWHGVLARTDDGALRTVALRALVGSASRGTAWRAEAGLTPAAIALPGAS